MPRPWRLTRQAEESLSDIASWTRENFGARQADHYADALIETCQKIAEGAAITRSCQKAIDASLPPELMLVRCGAHLIVFVESDTAVTIIDVVHGQRDLPRRLKGLR